MTTFAVYQQVRSFDFVNYDDQDYVSENQYVQSGLSREGVRWAFTTSHGNNWHPLTWLSHMLDCELFGLDAGRHHLVNLLLHIINTLLLFAVFKQMTGGLWASSFVAALFALHPLHVESVAWVSERKDLLSNLFWLLTMAVYLRYVRGHGAGWHLLMLLAFSLGLMAKPMLVTLPFVLLLLDFWPLGRFQKNRNVFYQLVREKAGLFVISAGSCVVTLIIEGKGVASSLELIPLGMRIANAPISYMKYIIKMIWPIRLAVLYPYPGEDLSTWQAVAAGVLLAGITILVIRLNRSYKYLVVGWLWFLGTLVPVIGLIQVGPQAMADRYSYIPLTGLFIIIAWGVPELLIKWKYRRTALGIAGVAVVLALSVCSWSQTKYWRNSEALCRQALKVTKNNYIMHNNLGYALQSQGKTNEAMSHFRQALQINPHFAESYNNLGIALQLQGKLDDAIDYYYQTLKVASNHPKAHYNLGIAFQLQGKVDKAISHYRKALEVTPDDAKIHSNLGIALKTQGKLEEAVSHFHQALRFKPDNAKILYNLGSTIASQGKLNEAINYYRQALQISPDDAEVHNSLGAALSEQGKFEEAAYHYRQALRTQPDHPAPMSGLSWILATHPDVNMRDAGSAIRLAERAAELTGYRDAFILNTLAAAYAAGGRYDQAIKTAQGALSRALAEKDKELANHIRSHIELYRRAKP